MPLPPPRSGRPEPVRQVGADSLSGSLAATEIVLVRAAAQRMPMPAIYRLRFTGPGSEPEISGPGGGQPGGLV